MKRDAIGISAIFVIFMTPIVLFSLAGGPPAEGEVAERTENLHGEAGGTPEAVSLRASFYDLPVIRCLFGDVLQFPAEGASDVVGHGSEVSSSRSAGQPPVFIPLR